MCVRKFSPRESAGTTGHSRARKSVRFVPIVRRRSIKSPAFRPIISTARIHKGLHHQIEMAERQSTGRAGKGFIVRIRRRVDVVVQDRSVRYDEGPERLLLSALPCTRRRIGRRSYAPFPDQGRPIPS